ncbi:sensor histidine kinase KdpD [soil metagenome]
MSELARPNPDALLAELTASEATDTRGRLKIFLGMCPGVGKTYAMLLDAQQRHEEGEDIVIGCIETHGRIETTALTAGLSRIPRRKSEHRGVTLDEMDLDAILARAPAVVLVDELAHSNVPGSRHPKRYQDVLELLDAGIDVYTTLNVQHIESHRDVVTQIIGAPVHETVPDSIIDRAGEVELIDISPEQLRRRLDEGKVYLGERAVAASANFFREGNLKALREIVLRVTAERAERDLRDFMRARRISGPWKSRERFLVAVGPSPFSERLIRWTRRISTIAQGAWMAVYIDSGQTSNEDERNRLEKNLTLARTLGAEVLTAAGHDVSETLIRVAHEHNASQIVVGKPLSNPVFDFLRGGSVVDRLIRHSGDIDIYVVRAEKTAPPWRPSFSEIRQPRVHREFGAALLIVLGTTLLGLAVNNLIGYTAVGLIYLLAVLLGSMFLSRWPILLTGALTALAWNFLFITPYYTLFINNAHDVMLFGLYFVVAIVMGHLSTRLRQRERAERRREEEATALYRFSRDVVTSRSFVEAIGEGVRQIDSLFVVASSVLVGESAETLVAVAGQPLDAREMSVAAWTFEKKEAAGRFTDTLPQSQGLYLPLRAGDRVVGVLGLRARGALTLPERQLIETFAAQMALLIERDRLTNQAEVAALAEKGRQLQKTLLDSVSHEFKTPLSVISTAVDSLKNIGGSEASLIEEIRIAASRLHRIVANLLDITRIETGSVRPRLAWCDLREIIDQAVQRIAPEVEGRQVVVALPEEVTACRIDTGLLEEILINLLRNAAQQSAPGSEITIAPRAAPGGLLLRVLDQGPGVPPDQAERIFEKFQRGPASRPGGLGLGLSIVKGFAEAHGGDVKVVPREDGRSGAEFQIFLPVEVGNTEAIGT